MEKGAEEVGAEKRTRAIDAFIVSFSFSLCFSLDVKRFNLLRWFLNHFVVLRHFIVLRQFSISI
jgi:hypothetical protein